jgi:hypothetical protein
VFEWLKLQGFCGVNVVVLVGLVGVSKGGVCTLVGGSIVDAIAMHVRSAQQLS